MRVEALHHAQVMIPNGKESEARAFYVELLGLPEVEKPAVLARRGGLWVQVGAQQIHLGAEKPGVSVGGGRAHVALVVDNLEAWRARLTAAHVSLEDGEQLPDFHRFELRDPFGNRIEFLQTRAT
jgi:catechol 2,3-dioxygenase-like lactoylglutathione lyase family enzyme